MRKCSGCIVTRKKKGKTQVLMVRSSSGQGWVHPKGGIEPGLSARASALKELYEEAGILAVQSKRLGTVMSHGKYGICSIEFFHVRNSIQLDKYPERKTRKRRWMSVREAMLNTKKDVRPVLKLAVTL